MASVNGGTSAVFDSRLTCNLEIIVTEDSVNANENYSRCYVWVGVVYNSNIGFSGSTRDTAGVATANVNNADIFSGNVSLPSGATNGTALLYQDGYVNVYHEDDGSRTVGFNIRMDRGSGNYSGDPYVWGPSGRYYGALTLTKITRDWTVSYNGNGGSTPASQNKHYGANITLGSSSREGYTFQYWKGSDGVNYSAGQTFTGNYALTLTAVWSINTWQVSFNANGGTNAPGNQTKTYGQTLTITSAVPSRTLYDFVSWSGSDGVTYYQNSQFTGNYALTLTANWKLAYVAPTITSLAAYHCTSDGTAADDGTYIKVTIGWKVDTSIYSDNQGSGITVTIDSTNVGTISISGTSGAASQVFGGSYNGDVTSNVSVYLYDTKQPGLGVSNSVLAQGATYLMDFSSDGNVCFGGAADGTYQICTKRNGVITWHP